MNKKIKKASLVVLPFMMLITSCIPPVDDSLTKIVTEKVQIVNPKTGTITGSISVIEGNITKASIGNISIRVSRAKPVLDKSNNIIEKAGKSLGTYSINETGQFIIPNLLPGDVQLQITGLGTSERIVKVTEGSVTKINNIVLGTPPKTGTVVTTKEIILSGKVFLPTGEPAPKAIVADVTKGFTSLKVEAGQDGSFAFKTPPFSTPKTLEVTLGKVTTSFTVQPDQIENIEIPLLENSRPVIGRIIDSVNKKPVENLQVIVSDTAIGAVTDKEGKFIIKGVPLAPVSLDIGGLSGYIQRKQPLPLGTNSDQVDLKTIEIVPLGNLLVNVSVEDSLDHLEVRDLPPSSIDAVNVEVRDTVLPLGSVLFPIDSIEKSAERLRFYSRLSEPISCGNVPVSSSTSTTGATGSSVYPQYYLSNLYRHLEPLQGVVQLEGTDIVKNFSYEITPTLDPKPDCPVPGSIDKKAITVYLRNFIHTISIPGLPGGEYSLSVSINAHETQKGIKIVVPSNDTISTENIKLKRVKRIVTIGDVTGKVLFKDIAGNKIDIGSVYNNLPAVDKRFIVVASLTSESDLRDNRVLLQVLTGTRTGEKIGNLNPYVITDSVYDGNAADNPIKNLLRGYIENNGDFVLKNVASGTRVLIAAVLNKVGENYSFDPQFIPSAYTSLNVVGNVDNRAPDLYITRRNFRQ